MSVRRLLMTRTLSPGTGRECSRTWENCRRICPKRFAPVLATNCVICFTRPLRRLAAQFGKCTKQIIAGAGVHLRRVLPHPVKNAATFAHGRHGVIVNVFTEPEWRRKGLAGMLLKQIIDWSRDEKLDRLLLHASANGRALYERLGFVAANEMRFAGSDSVSTK